MMEPRNGKHYRLAEGLCGLLADTYVLYNTTQVAYWNVDGPNCNSFQRLFETQYRELGAAVDLLAQRMRRLGIYAPGSLGEYVQFSRLRQTSERGSQRILKQLADDHGKVTRRIRMVLDISREAGDEITSDLLSQRLRVHERSGSELERRLKETRQNGTASASCVQGTLPLDRSGARQQVPA